MTTGLLDTSKISNKTSRAAGEAQPASTENENLALRASVPHLDRDLTEAHNRIRELTESKSLLRHTASNPAPARGNKNAVPPPPPKSRAPQVGRQSSVLPLGPSGFSFPALVTCLVESVLAGVGLNKSYTGPPVFNGTDRELYKDWTRAVLRKLKMSAFLYPTPESGVPYMASRLAVVTAEILNQAIDEGEPEADDTASAFLLLDDSFLDSDEYGTALAAMERLIMKADDMVDTFLAKWNKLNIKLGRDKNSRPSITEFSNKLPASLTSKLLDLRPTSTLAQLVERARWVEQNLIQLNQYHPRESKPPSTHRTRIPLARTSIIPSPSSAPSAPQTNTNPCIPRLEEAAKQLARKQDFYFPAESPDIEQQNAPPLVPTTAPRTRRDPLHLWQASNPSKKSRKTRGPW